MSRKSLTLSFEDLIDGEFSSNNEIYPDKIIFYNKFSKEMKLKISPNKSLLGNYERSCEIHLQIKFQKGYPLVKPKIDILEFFFLTDQDIQLVKKNLDSLAEELSQKKEEMLFYIIDELTNFIDSKYKEYNLIQSAGSLSSNSKSNIPQLNRSSKEQDIYKDLKELLRTESKETHVNLIRNLENEDINLSKIDINAQTKSRFRSDFEILGTLGIGGGGAVYKVKNKLDSFYYAIKKIKINFNNVLEAKRILREVMLLSRLNHKYIVKYLQAWIEDPDDKDDNLLDIYEYNNDLSEVTKTELDDVIEEVNSESESENIYESNSNLEFIEDKKGIDIWNEEPSEPENEKLKESRIEEERKEKRKNYLKNKKNLFIQMEFCEGKTLREFINDKSLSDDKSKWTLIIHLIEAINYIHQNNLIHRDIKPSNIFLNKNLEIKLGDFGLATLSKSKNYFEKSSLIKKDLILSKEGEFLSCGVGTVYYCSPEQEKGSSYDEKTDIFSLGIVIFEMFFSFGSMMHRDIVLKEIREKNHLPQAFIKSSSENLVKLVHQLTNIDPKKRPFASELIFSNLIPLHYSDTVLSAYFTKIIDMEEHQKFFDIYLKKKILNLEKNKLNLYHFQDSLNKNYLDNSSYLKKITRNLISVFEKHNAEELLLPNLESYDNFTYVNTLSKYNDHLNVKAIYKTNKIINHSRINNLFLNFKGEPIQIPHNIYKRIKEFISETKILYTKSYVFENSEEINNSNKTILEKKFLSFFLIWKDHDLIIFDKESIEKELFQVIFESLDSLNISNYYMKINSTFIIDQIFDRLEINIENRCNVIRIFNQFKKENEIRKKLEELKLSQAQIKFLMTDLKLDPKSKKSFPEFEVLYQFFSKYFSQKMNKIAIDFSIFPENLTHYSGTFFEVYHNKTLIINGGRFDNHLHIESNQNVSDYRGISFRVNLNEILYLSNEIEENDCYKIDLLITLEFDEKLDENNIKNIEKVVKEKMALNGGKRESRDISEMNKMREIKEKIESFSSVMHLVKNKQIDDFSQLHFKLECLENFQKCCDFKEYYEIFRMRHLMRIKGDINKEQVIGIFSYKDSKNSLIEFSKVLFEKNTFNNANFKSCIIDWPLEKK